MATHMPLTLASTTMPLTTTTSTALVTGGLQHHKFHVLLLAIVWLLQQLLHRLVTYAFLLALVVFLSRNVGLSKAHSILTANAVTK